MKISEKWLKEWINPKMKAQKLGDKLTMVGLELDALAPVCEGKLDQVVVGQVVSLEAHPDADKLRVCQVKTGRDQQHQIVCGAANVREGGKYPTALPGAELPNGLSIKPTKLRGVSSQGMLCSSAELGLSESADGLLSLPSSAPLGKSIFRYLDMDDVVLELGLTPNRGDCLSIRGIAREVGVISSADFEDLSVETIRAKSKRKIDVTVSAPDACPRYLGRVIEGVDAAAETPIWMQERLRRCGVRSISIIVDITNYVLLELGQPMHAFDLNQIDGGIQVRMAKRNEKLVLLDGQTVKLDDNSLVIADHSKALALAGIMGGEKSGVDSTTQDIVLESAFFDPLAIASKARQYNLHTDSSHRFERGVDYQQTRIAMERASGLVLEFAGGVPGPIVEVSDKKTLPSPRTVNLRASRIEKILGVSIATDQVTTILQKLGFGVKAKKGGEWTVTVPSFRFDVSAEIDLIEEVARIHGYENIPETDALFNAWVKPQSETKLELSSLQDLLVSRGYQEAITYSFVEPELQALLTDEDESAVVRLKNPISADLSVMQTSLLPSLIQALMYNQNRQQERVRLFESGLVFRNRKNKIEQVAMLAGLMSGSVVPEQWGTETREVDFFDAKSDVEALFALSGAQQRLKFQAGEHSAMHPGQTADVYIAQNKGEFAAVGRIGTLYPELKRKLGIVGTVVMFELALDVLLSREIPVFEPISKFPAIRRDLAILVDEAVSAQMIRDCVNKNTSNLLKKFQLFDEYKGKGIDSGRKSLAFGITLQDHDRTLVDKEVDTIIAKVIKALEQELGGTLRG